MIITDGKRKEKRRYLLFNDILVLIKPAKISTDRLVLIVLLYLHELVIEDGALAVQQPQTSPSPAVVLARAWSLGAK